MKDNQQTISQSGTDKPVLTPEEKERLMKLKQKQVNDKILIRK